MLDRIFGGRPAPGQPAGQYRPREKPFPEGVSCGAGCGKTTGWRCAYRDMTGRRCGYWCVDHSAYLNGRMWCQRHANSVKWLRARDGSIFEIGPSAAIDDRSPNLVGTLVDEFNDDITAHLKAVFGRRRGVQIVTDGNIRTAAIPRGRVERTATGPVILQERSQVAWERGWGVFSHTGYLARLVFRVTATEPPVVYVYVGGALILQRVPDWIANRGKGTDQRQDRANFHRGVLEAVRRWIFVEDPDL
jgi:hypothetical protein